MSAGSILDWAEWLRIPREALERDREAIERDLEKFNLTVAKLTVSKGREAICLLSGGTLLRELGQTPSAAASAIQRMAIHAREQEAKWRKTAGKGRARGTR